MYRGRKDPKPKLGVGRVSADERMSDYAMPDMRARQSMVVTSDILASRKTAKTAPVKEVRSLSSLNH